MAFHFHRAVGRRLGAGVGVMLWLLLPVASAEPQSAVAGRWWRDPSIQRDLRLTPAQARRLDVIFESDLQARLALHREIQRMDAELLRLILDEEDARVLQFVDDLQALRRKQNTRRALMLLEMYKVLTPTQRAQLASRSSRRSREGGR
jgi:Spy/CpxP family protein refolding chaperone